MDNLPVDIFIKEITYLSFDAVVSICNTNQKLHNYCTNRKYNTHWKALINNTFGGVDNYNQKLIEIWNDLDYEDNTYDYLVYTQLIKYFDPITQLIIYYRQGDNKSFDDKKFTKAQKFLSLFLLNKKDVIMNYLPSDAYLPFIDLLNNEEVSKEILDKMLIEMAKEGNILGVKYFQQLGSNIRYKNDWALRLASEKGHLEVVKYLIQKGADIHADDDDALAWASKEGHLDVVKYLIEKGANVHADNDHALRWASGRGHLEVVKFLHKEGADIHVLDDYALKLASRNGHLDIVKYLIENSANIHAADDWALREASGNGHLEIVKYLIENGANIHAQDDYALRWTSSNVRLKIWDYLKSNKF